MKIKSKLTLGIGLLVMFIVLLVLLSTFKVRTLAADTKNILTANYNTLEYARYMLKALDEIAVDKEALNKFHINLSRQKNNITETGEAALTDNLELHFKQYLVKRSDPALPRMIRNDIDAIMKINMNAIERKSKFANNTAEETIRWVAIVGSLCFLIAFVMLLNLPGSIANPIKELDTARTNFIANVSHEFKTPISSIKLGVQILENSNVGNLNEEQKGLIEGIKEDANRLLKITGELLNMTQVESGNIQLSMRPVEANEILHYALTANKVAADQKNIRLEAVIPPGLPKVMADNEKTAWVLTNLISNAIRYSYDNSSVFIAVGAAADNILLSVKDTGQGIAPQYREKIFDRYFRVPGTKKEGTGLGLAISKEFIEAQGGKITVETDFGVGSTFTVSLKKA